MKINRSVVIKSFIWKLLEKSSVQIVSFIVTIILARLLTPSEYGLVALIMIFISLANVIIEGGLNTALIQKKNLTILIFQRYFILVCSFPFFCMLYFFLQHQ